MALPLAQELKPHLVIYDCMDELSAFMSAPRQLLQTNAFDRDFFGARNADFHRDLTQPCSATDAEMPGLADQQRPSITRVHFGQNAMKRQASIVGRRLVPQDALAMMLPLGMNKNGIRPAWSKKVRRGDWMADGNKCRCYARLM